MLKVLLLLSALLSATSLNDSAWADSLNMEHETFFNKFYPLHDSAQLLKTRFSMETWILKDGRILLRASSACSTKNKAAMIGISRYSGFKFNNTWMTLDSVYTKETTRSYSTNQYSYVGAALYVVGRMPEPKDESHIYWGDYVTKETVTSVFNGSFVCTLSIKDTATITIRTKIWYKRILRSYRTFYGVKFPDDTAYYQQPIYSDTTFLYRNPNWTGVETIKTPAVKEVGVEKVFDVRGREVSGKTLRNGVYFRVIGKSVVRFIKM